MSASFIEETIRGFTRALSKALVSEQAAMQPGFLQRFDPRVRVAGLLSLVIAVVLCRRLLVIAGMFLAATLIALVSRVRVASLAKRVWLIVFGFTGLIALPALFVTPGDPILRMPLLHLVVSAQGLRAAGMLVLRVETAVTLTTALVFCTPWTHVLKALASLRVPAEIITMLAMTHRYVFLLIETANQMFESRQSRTVGILTGAQRRALAGRTAGVLLSKSIEMSHEVYLAMLSRGFRGEIRLLSEFRMRARDYAGLGAFVAAGCMAVWVGR